MHNSTKYLHVSLLCGEEASSVLKLYLVEMSEFLFMNIFPDADQCSNTKKTHEL